jgi:hypothetical protein
VYVKYKNRKGYIGMQYNEPYIIRLAESLIYENLMPSRAFKEIEDSMQVWYYKS